MEIEVKNTIFKTVRDVILIDQPGKWVSVSTEIYENLDRLNPSTCDDGDTGKIAFGAEDRRMKIRTGRFLTRKLHLNSGFLNDVQIRTIQTKIDDILFGGRISTCISTGSDIKRNYQDDVGGSSCMSGGNSNFVGLYVDNPEVYSQLIMWDGADSARAMIIKLDNGKYLLDRTYATSESLLKKMQIYADNQGWFYRDKGECVQFNGEIITDQQQIIVTGLDYIDGEVPYQDTLSYGRIQDGCLDLMYSDIHDFDFTTDNIGGYIGDGDNCADCGGRISEGEGHWFSDTMYCECCFNQVAFYCGHCSESTDNDNSVYISSESMDVCLHCAEYHYSFCDECEEYFSIGDTQYVESTSRAVCDSCLDNYHQECTDCREFFPPDDLIEFEAGDKVCRDCRENEPDREKDEVGGALMQMPMQNIICEGQMEIQW